MLRALLTPIFAAALAIGAASGAWAQPIPGKAGDDPDAAWRRMTPEQRESLWRQMTPEQKIDTWKRLPPEQRQAIRQRLTPEQRDTIRQRMQERRENGDIPGRRFSPEERRQLRDQILESNRSRPPQPGKRAR